MKITLSEDDIRSLRYVRSHPDIRGLGLERLVNLGLVEEYELRRPADRRTAASAISRAKRLMQKLAKAKFDPAEKDRWVALTKTAGEVVNSTHAFLAYGHRISPSGLQLLRDIDAAIRNAKWNVNDKRVELEMNA